MLYQDVVLWGQGKEEEETEHAFDHRWGKISRNNKFPEVACRHTRSRMCDRKVYVGELTPYVARLLWAPFPCEEQRVPP